MKTETTGKIMTILFDFYISMYSIFFIESNYEKMQDKMGVKIIMTINDIEKLIKTESNEKENRPRKN